MVSVPEERVANDHDEANGKNLDETKQNDATQDEPRPRILEMFDAAAREGRPLHISAPMVRYSKLPFRLLLRSHRVDLTYTPMMLAHEFIRSPFARDSDFTTNSLERAPTAPDNRPHALVAQFASSDPTEFARAAQLIGPWVDGVDLNCGCPQSWAVKEGIGCALLEQGGRVAAMVRAARAVLDARKSVSVKIRIAADVRRTVAFVRGLEGAGVDFVTVHGRLKSQRSSTAPDYGAVRAVRDGVGVPVVVNGDVYAAGDVRRVVELTGAKGVMAARGMLENPALFEGAETTPAACVREFLEWSVRCPMPFSLVLHHVAEMTARMPGMTKGKRRRLLECRDLVDLIDYVESKWKP